MRLAPKEYHRQNGTHRHLQLVVLNKSPEAAASNTTIRVLPSVRDRPTDHKQALQRLGTHVGHTTGSSHNIELWHGRSKHSRRRKPTARTSPTSPTAGGQVMPIGAQLMKSPSQRTQMNKIRLLPAFPLNTYRALYWSVNPARAFPAGAGRKEGLRNLPRARVPSWIS